MTDKTPGTKDAIPKKMEVIKLTLPANNPYAQYKARSLETMTNGEIIVRLFEEASKQISTAIFLTSQGEDVKAFNCISKAQKVVSTLSLSLDMSYGISLQLSDLYTFIHGELGKAVAAKDAASMKSMLGMVDELKVTFRQAERMARAGKF
ncbi:MAG: flagellar protein FliS [Clostridiales Family XIII bacterium]|jgi:flagellar protein FliS|nr:flagellar protein FliS [Clostridiales Family XIII bacterium]